MHLKEHFSVTLSVERQKKSFFFFAHPLYSKIKLIYSFTSYHHTPVTNLTEIFYYTWLKQGKGAVSL